MPSAVPLLWSWQAAPPHLWMALAAIGLLAVIGQIAMTAGYGLAAVSRLGPLTYSNVVFSTIMGWLFWNETLDSLTWAGAVCVCLAGIVTSYKRNAVVAAPGSAHPVIKRQELNAMKCNRCRDTISAGMIRTDKRVEVTPMIEKADVFDETYHRYLRKIATLDFGAIAADLGVETDGEAVTVPFFNTPYRVTREGVSAPGGKPAAFGVGVVLCNYLIQCPRQRPAEDRWHAYKDFKDAAPLAGTFANTVERPIAGNFTGRLADLEKAGRILGGTEPSSTYPYDLNLTIRALPRIPLLLLFNDADEEFPADCKVLFEKRAESYLDMECLAILGMLLAEYLRRCSRA